MHFLDCFEWVVFPHVEQYQFHFYVAEYVSNSAVCFCL